MKYIPLTSTFPDLSGCTLDGGRYYLLDVLGAGAYGKVYRAIDNHTPKGENSYCAIKCLQKPKPGSKEELFQHREFTLHQRVSDHPNVVTFRHAFYAGSWVFVVLDLCDGGEMFTAITEHNAFFNDDDLVKSAFIQLIDAVSHCHQSGVFHRDIKPENILFSGDGSQLYLADYGLCTDKRVSDEFRCGSSFYMSPECIGKEFDPKPFSTRLSDVWSLGIVLTTMLSGRHPWRYAMTSDACFISFLKDPDFLYKTLPISKHASRILRGIFVINPRQRTTLSELRRQILAAETFFKTEAETETMKRTGPIVIAESATAAKTNSEVAAAESSGGSETGNEEVQATVGRMAALNVEEDGNVSSEPESEGPITPPNNAVEPEVEVPDMPEGQNMGQRLLPSIRMHLPRSLVPSLIEKQPRHRAPSSSDKPPPRRSQFLKRAAQRLKMIPGSGSSS